MVTARQIANAKKTLLQALAEGQDPGPLGAHIDTRFVPPVWKIILPAAEGTYKRMPGYPRDVTWTAIVGAGLADPSELTPQQKLEAENASLRERLAALEPIPSA